MSSFKVYYINLDKSLERRNFMENQFKKLNIPLTRMPAVYGKELPQDFLKKAKSQFNIFTHYPNLNDGEIGLTKTYFDLWKIIGTQKEDFAIILEDDALLTDSFFEDLELLLKSITKNTFLDISGRKGFYEINSTEFTSTFLVPSLQTTGQIIGKKAAEILFKNLNTYYAPIDVLKQDVFKHKTPVLTTNKCYVTSNDKNVGGTTIQQKKMPKFKKIVREIVRPFWQLITLLTYKTYRFLKNYAFYKSN
ncbi:glycosyltransferase family 25 protein [Polaribacter aestuariivivens]|nr:glycosyltransferase family 25 protein [Polaribacter aestuariivivens]